MVAETKLRSYPKIYNLGHRYIADLFDGPVVIQEKIDGSQLSWSIDSNGDLSIRSKKAVIHIGNVPDIFNPSVQSIIRMYEEGRLSPYMIYRGEAMRAPRHNSLEYERAPKGNIVLFDVDRGEEDREEDQMFLEHIANTLGIECVQLVKKGVVESLNKLEDLLKRPSQLGGSMEGIVIKNYNRWSPLDGKMLMGKLVAEEFRELHGRQWKGGNPNKTETLSKIVEIYRSENRWLKAVAHLRERGELTDSPKDIGPLMKEVQVDLEEECADEISQILWKHYRKNILRGAASGLPEWYKQRLLEQQEFGNAVSS